MRSEHKNAAGNGKTEGGDVETQDARMQVPPHKTNTEYLTLTLRVEYILTHFTGVLPASEQNGAVRYAVQ